MHQLRREWLPWMANGLGASKLIDSIGGQRQAMTLTFHGVYPDHLVTANRTHMQLRNFRNLMLQLASSYDIVPLSELVSAIRSGETFSRKTIALTFDDGHENFLWYAWPVLQALHIPATIFPMGSVIRDPDWVICWDFLRSCDTRTLEQIQNWLFRNGFEQLRYDEIKVGAWTSSIGRGESLEAAIRALGLRQHSRNHLSKTSAVFWKLMTPKQLVRLHKSGLIEIGSHCMHHYYMPALSDANLYAELIESKLLLEELVDERVTTVAYPFGSADARVLMASIQAGYDVLVTGNMDDHFKVGQSDVVYLPRLCVSNTIGADANRIRLSMAFST